MLSRVNKVLLLVLLLSLSLNAYFFILLQPKESLPKGQVGSAFDGLANSQPQRSDGAANTDIKSDSFAAPTWQQLRDDLNYLFEGGEMKLAFAGAAAAATHYSRPSQALVREWFALTRESLVADNSLRNLQRSQGLLDATGGQYYNTSMYRWLQAELHFANNNNLAAIDLFIELQRNADAETRDQLQARLLGVLTSRMDEFYNNEQWSDGLELVDRLLWHRPDDGQMLLAKSDLLIAQLRYPEAEQALQAALTIPSHKKQAREKLEELRLLRLRGASVSLDPVGDNQFLVSVLVNPNTSSRQSSANLLLDTGASLTVLRREYFERMPGARRAQFVRNAIMSTAGGQVEAPIYRFASFAVGPFQLQNFEIVVMDYPSQRSSGLLGMNFLGRFDFEIDQKNELLILSPKL